MTNNPDVLFVLRPHPISGITRWIESLGEHRNLFVLYKDSADPWILKFNYGNTCWMHDRNTVNIRKEDN